MVHFLRAELKKMTMENKSENTRSGNNRNENGSNKQQQQTNATNGSNTKKDPDEWTTGDEPMTGAQRSYLKTLSDEAGEEFNDNLTKAEASKRIDELQHKTGRGLKDEQS
jgi:hypothetical protein